jgi:hypothetical protein
MQSATACGPTLVNPWSNPVWHLLTLTPACSMSVSSSPNGSQYCLYTSICVSAELPAAP